ncbi:MAG: hypothetical protein OXG69_07855 [bacterium]|nr:hypothetical protein [bacterium]
MEVLMLVTLLVAVLVPAAVLVVGVLLRHWSPRFVGDLRGIALQTVIIMVVLLAVAGAVAGVLLARGGEAVSDIESQQIRREPSDYSGFALCEAAGFTVVTSGGAASTADLFKECTG